MCSPLWALAALAGCAPAGLSSGVPRDVLFTDAGFDAARRICEAEDAFWAEHLPARERVELDCSIEAINGSGDASSCLTARAECIERTPVVTVDGCVGVLPPPMDCRVTVGDYEDCVAWIILHASRLHAFADCAALDDPDLYASLAEISSEEPPPACERARRDCPRIFP